MQKTISLSETINKIAAEIVAEFAHVQLKENELAIALIDLTEETGGASPAPTCAHFRGDEPIFPASIVKLFYLAAVHQWLEDKKIAKLKNSTRDQRHDCLNLQMMLRTILLIFSLAQPVDRNCRLMK